MSQVEVEEIQWVWYPYIPYGKITVVQGDPGEGKTTFVLALIALLTQGKPLPEEENGTEPINVIYQTAEDGLADTIKPRLLMDKYKKEQQEKSILAAQFADQLTHSQEVETDIREWVSLIQGSKDIERLDRELLIKLVEKIVVGIKSMVDGVERQEITIIYNLVGQID
jgi:KaiC/GvpD/RAD55 family RecA-like ATPase